MNTIETLARAMKKKADELHAIPVDDLLGFFDALGASWEADTVLQKRIKYLRPLAAFIRRNRLQPMVSEALRGDEHILDRRIGRLHAQPRGLAVHWLAGNAALLGCYSLIQTLLTKNVSIVKPASRAHEDFEALLMSFSTVNTAAVSGETIRSFVAVVHADRTERHIHEALSKEADIRIAWGGEEAVSAIMSLPKSVYCEDIIFGPKYSFGVIDRASLADADAIAKKIALDVCTFDQFACSSPHTIFVERNGAADAASFARMLADALDVVGKKMIKKSVPGNKKQMDIRTFRAAYAMKGRVISSLDTEWTVIVTDEPGLAPACGSRVVFVKPVDRVDEAVSLVSHRIQTLGAAMTEETADRVLDTLTLHGIDRVVPFGSMTFFDSPWDGMFVLDRLVRWVAYRTDARL
jgi:hypothetical protein